jgi:hypothetical protein
MKRIITLLVFLLAVTTIFAQDEYYNRDEELVNDPAVSYDINRPIETIQLTQPEIAPEAQFSSGRQSVNIPIAYPFGNLVLGANVPVQRITATSGDKSKSAIGIGDASVMAAYSGYLPNKVGMWDAQYAADVSVKLPTGDKDNEIKIDGTNFATPMGTGSMDITAAGNLLLSTASREILADVKYRINGEDEDEVKFGNMLVLKGRYGFLDFEPKFNGYLGLQSVIVADGEAGSNTIESSMFLLDFAPELHYLTNYGMFRVGFTMPMITSSDTKFTREVTVRFGLSKQY